MRGSRYALTLRASSVQVETKPFLGDRFLSSASIGMTCALPMRVPDCIPILDKICAPMGPDILSGAGIWGNILGALPDSISVLDQFLFATFRWHPTSSRSRSENLLRDFVFAWLRL